MKSSIRFTQSAKEDLIHFRKDQQTLILDGVAKFLAQDAEVESRRRKVLRPNPLAKWELRLDDLRVFYNVEDQREVSVIAVGSKQHNDLFIRGKKVEL